MNNTKKTNIQNILRFTKLYLEKNNLSLRSKNKLVGRVTLEKIMRHYSLNKEKLITNENFNVKDEEYDSASPVKLPKLRKTSSLKDLEANLNEYYNYNSNIKSTRNINRNSNVILSGNLYSCNSLDNSIEKNSNRSNTNLNSLPNSVMRIINRNVSPSPFEYSSKSLKNIFNKTKKSVNPSSQRFNNDLFDLNEYKNLIYDESKIFGRAGHVQNYIENQINILKSKHNENQIDKFIKNINIKNHSYQMVFRSLIIKFIDVNSTSPNFQFFIPFSLLPIFYYKGVEFFLTILSRIVKFHNNYEEIEIDEEFIYSILSNNDEAPEIPSCSNSNNNSPINSPRVAHCSTFKYRKSCSVSPEFTEINRISTMIRRVKSRRKSECTDSPFLNDISKETNLNPKIINIYNKHDRSNNNNTKSKYFYNIYKYLWVTPKTTYNLEIKLPSVTFIETENNVQIYKFLDYEFLFFLLENGFKNWDFYMLNYLFSFRKFRNIFESYFIKSKILLNKIGSNLNKEKGFIEGINSIKNTTINLEGDKIYKSNEYENIITYIYTNEQNINYIIKIKGIIFKVFYSLISENVEIMEYYNVHFNYKQIKSLINFTSKIPFENLYKLLRNFVDINNNMKVEFNFLKFDSMTNENWKIFLDEEYYRRRLQDNINRINTKINIEQEFIEEHLKNNEEKDGLLKNKLKFILKYESLFPKVHIFYVNSNDKLIMKSEYSIESLMNKLIGREIDEYPLIINEFIKEKEELNVNRSPRLIKSPKKGKGLNKRFSIDLYH